MSDIDTRLDRLESLVEQQQETIEEQQETIERQRERIAELEGDGSGEEEDDTETMPAVSRRGALTAGGLLALLFGGVGTASADAQGQVGTSQDPLSALYTGELNGGVTGNTQLTNLVGEGLTLDSGTLTATYVQNSEPTAATTGTAWFDPASLRIRNYIDLGTTVQATAYGDDGENTQYLYAGGKDGSVYRITAASVMSSDNSVSPTSNEITSLAVGTDGSDKYVYAGSRDDYVYKIVPSDMSMDNSYNVGNIVGPLTLGSDGSSTFLYSGDASGNVEKIDPSDMSHISGSGYANPIGGLVIGDDGTDSQYIYAGTHAAGTIIHKIDPSNMSQSATFDTAGAGSLALGQNGSLYAGTAPTKGDATIYKINPSDMTSSGSINTSSGEIHALTYGNDGYLYAGDNRNTLYSIDPTDMTVMDTVGVGSYTYSLSTVTGSDVIGGIGSTLTKLTHGSLQIRANNRWVEQL